MTTSFINFFLGLILGIIPLIIDVKKRTYKSKPLWYRISLPIVIILYSFVGGYKLYSDEKFQGVLTKAADDVKVLRAQNKIAAGKEDSLVKDISVRKTEHNILLERLDSIGIEVKNNKPTIINKTYNNKIDYVKQLNQ